MLKTVDMKDKTNSALGISLMLYTLTQSSVHSNAKSEFGDDNDSIIGALVAHFLDMLDASGYTVVKKEVI